MASTEQLLSFLIATAVFAYIPGPAMLYTAAQTIAHGSKAGWMAALGIHIGGYAHVIAAALGLSVLFVVVPALYAVVKLAGAAYLIWLGVQLILPAKNKSDSPSGCGGDGDSENSSRRTIWQSMTVEILNPKTAVFYIAFLPQFTDPAGVLPLWGQLIVLGTFVNVAFSSADILCIILASSIVNFFKASRAGNRIAHWVGGGILISLGVNLAVSRQ